jgi:hypothetical protein
MNYTDALQDKLLFALDGKYRELRDDAHVQPDVVLVYDEATDTVEPVELVQLPLRYPCTGPGARWSPSDLGNLVASKAKLYRQSCIAHEISDDDPESEPVCGVPVLQIPVRPGPFHWAEVTSRIIPGRQG